MLTDYQKFVSSTTSDASLNLSSFATRTVDLAQNETHINIPLLLTAGIGLSSETGEFNEIIKKVTFQGKELNEDTRYHMKRELGDIFWYLANAATALGYSLDEILKENIAKLEARYPNGFEIVRSENRKEGDL